MTNTERKQVKALQPVRKTKTNKLFLHVCLLFVVAFLYGCKPTLTQTQVVEIAKFAEATDAYSDFPSVVIQKYADISPLNLVRSPTPKRSLLVCSQMCSTRLVLGSNSLSGFGSQIWWSAISAPTSWEAILAKWKSGVLCLQSISAVVSGPSRFPMCSAIY